MVNSNWNLPPLKKVLDNVAHCCIAGAQEWEMQPDILKLGAKWLTERAVGSCFSSRTRYSHDSDSLFTAMPENFLSSTDKAMVLKGNERVHTDDLMSAALLPLEFSEPDHKLQPWKVVFALMATAAKPEVAGVDWVSQSWDH